MLASMLRELRYLLHNKWDLAMVVIAPLFIILLFGSMFYTGKPDHLPIAVIDQDQSELSRNISRDLSLNHTLDVKYQTQTRLKLRIYSTKPKSGVMSTSLRAQNNVWSMRRMPKLVLCLISHF